MFCAEVVEHACSITSLQLGETLSNIAKDMDTITHRVPLGVTAGITPFNFPAMIPLWVSHGLPLASHPCLPQMNTAGDNE
jgi:acyl-CoA reductase-like NAD-dependent aldehyde dehydrogenase